MKRIFMATGGNGAQNLHRAVYPVQFCKDELAADGIELVLGDKLDLNQDWDALIFHKVIKPDFFPLMEACQKVGCKIAIELDDDIFSIPSWNPATVYFGQLERDCLDYTLKHADMVLVSTEPLAAVCQEHGGNVRVCPNLMDWSAWTRRQEATVPKVLWAGSVHHYEDLQLLVQPMKQIMAEFPAVQVLFMGDLPDEFISWNRLFGGNVAKMGPASGYPQLGYIESVPLEQYPHTLCSIAPHIGLCPLAPCAFNDSKSNLKAAEMTLAGAAVVASDLPPYRPLEACINLVQQDWVPAIRHLLNNPDAIEHQASVALDVIKKEWCWHGEKKKIWLNTFKELVQ